MTTLAIGAPVPRAPAPRRPRRLPAAAGWALALSLLGHALWLTGGPDHPPVATDPPPPGAMHTRSIAASAPGAPAPVAAATEQPATSAPVPARRVAAPAATPAGVPATPLAPAPATNTDSDSDPDAATFLPRSALTRAPQAAAAVLLDFPAGVPDGRYATELTLFIDEAGTVQRVRVDGAALPPPLEQVARQAFGAARFSPGEVQGRPVRARLRVAVEFVSDPLARPVGVPQ